MRTSRTTGTMLICAAMLGCATTTTQLAPVARDDIAAEEAAQRQLVLQELSKAQDRLNDIAYPLLVAATPFCAGKTGPRLGLAFQTVYDYKGVWVPAARAALGLSDTATVVSVTTGSPADKAGFRKGDRIVAVGAGAIVPGATASGAVTKAITAISGTAVEFGVARDGESVRLSVVPETVCDLGAVVIVDGDINAFADGKNIIFPWAMMRFADDDELRAVVAHEIAHNAMGHIEARRKNATWGAIFGALVDVAAATQGVNTGGQNTANFMQAGAIAFSQDFEREADYVGMYIMARAGVPLSSGPNLWRQFAQINPRAIGYASTHPTTAERFVRLRAAIEEIERKQHQGLELVPEMRARSR